MRHVQMVLGLTVWATTAWGCGAVGTSEIDASAYDQTCSSNGDCAEVREGDACGTCDCPNAAINRADQDTYSAKYQELRSSCGDLPAIACDCEQSVVYCGSDSGECAIRERIEREPAAFDQSCSVDSDCVAVRSGEVCSVCGCADAAINVGARDAYDALAEGVDCGVSLADCAACPASTVTCQDSVCVVQDS